MLMNARLSVVKIPVLHKLNYNAITIRTLSIRQDYPNTMGFSVKTSGRLLAN